MCDLTRSEAHEIWLLLTKKADEVLAYKDAYTKDVGHIESVDDALIAEYNRLNNLASRILNCKGEK